MSKSIWPAVGAIGALLGGLAAVLAVVAPSLEATDGFQKIYVDSCEQRVRAINLRAARMNADGAPAMDFAAPKKWCQCTGGVMAKHFDADTVRGVSDWFNAVALGGGERDAEEEFFADYTLPQRRKLESAYDFSSRECNKQLR